MIREQIKTDQMNAESFRFEIPVRQYSELDLHRMWKKGLIGKDARGYFTYEIEIDAISGKPVQGEKFYFEDSYQYLERRMIEVQRELCKAHLPAAKLALEYELSLLMELHGGLADLPDGILMLSVRQIKEWMEDRRTPGELLQYMVECGANQNGYMSQFLQELEVALQRQSLS